MDTQSSSEPGPAQGRHGRKVRNVLFVMCDQLRADHLGCYGGSGALTTPHIDRLAAQGARFDRAFVTSAVCGPSRTSFYTGCHCR
jgi:arylsulfatase A-like enzyme